MVCQVVIGDDHHLVRAGFAALIERMTEFELAGEAATGWEVIELVRKIRPHLLLLDISMPELNGLEVLDTFAAMDGAPRTIVISVHDESAYAQRALDSGAAGYLLKDSAAPELELAMRAAMRGEVYLSPRIAASVLTARRNGDSGHRSPLDQLTRRQRQVLQLLAEGYRTRDIAEKLNVSIKTVETHRSNIAGRLGVSDLPTMTRLALRYGLISDQPS